MNVHQVGIVVPTLGTRPDFLQQALASVRDAGNCYLVVVAPDPDVIRSSYPHLLFDNVIKDSGQGLPQAINIGMRSFPKSVEFVNWLGDDDLLSPGSLRLTSKILEQSPKTVCVYGQCTYIGPMGEALWVNRSGRYARWLMRVGPQLIPQPGALFRLRAFDQVGGLNPHYKWAFDLDLLLKLSQIGELQYIPRVLSSFRWHHGSLSVGGRTGSVSEASAIRRKYLPKLLQGISPLWELIVRRLVLTTGQVLSRRLHNIGGPS